MDRCRVPGRRRPQATRRPGPRSLDQRHVHRARRRPALHVRNHGAAARNARVFARVSADGSDRLPARASQLGDRQQRAAQDPGRRNDPGLHISAAGRQGRLRRPRGATATSGPATPPRCSIARLPSRNPCWTNSLGSRASQPTRRGSSTRRSSQTYTPNNFAWESLADPDMSDGWVAP